MEKKVTLRKLVHTGLSQCLREEHLLPTELNELTDHILDTSCLSIDNPPGSNETKIHLRQYNSFGIGEENKDKSLNCPSFLIFELGRAQVLETFFNIQQYPHSVNRTWSLLSYPNFAEVDYHLSHNMLSEGTRMAVLMDGKPLDYKAMDNVADADRWSEQRVIHWDFDVFKLTFVCSGEEITETYSCKKLLELRILQLVKEKATEIQVTNLIDKKLEHFTVSGEVYCSKPKDRQKEFSMLVGRPHLSWILDMEDTDDEEDWED